MGDRRGREDKSVRREKGGGWLNELIKGRGEKHKNERERERERGGGGGR